MYNNFSASTFPIPTTFIGYATKVVLILEFSPTIISVILAGKVGSYIASSIGTMRVTEQIDALDIMGVNTPNFLILPKILASVIFNPLLIAISIVFGIWGGYLAGLATGSWSAADYITGIQMFMPTHFVWYAFFKTAVFAFLIATVPAYFGYNVSGGSLEVGRASACTGGAAWRSWRRLGCIACGETRWGAAASCPGCISGRAGRGGCTAVGRTCLGCVSGGFQDDWGGEGLLTA